MTIKHRKRLGALALLATIAVGACSGGGATSAPSSGGASDAPGGASEAPASQAANLSGTVTIDGSSTVFPITQAVAEEFQIANSGVQVPVAFSGTGGGFKKFCMGETDMNDASRPIKEDDEGEGLACKAAGIEWIKLQVAIDGLTVVVNPANDFATCLTVAELSTIYGPDSPADLLWSQVRDGFPAEKVERYMPGADSGTFDYFTEEINGETDAATQFATQSEDDNTLVTGVAGSKYAIGFFGYAYYVENTDKLKALEIDGGEGGGCVAPTEATINDNSYAPLSRPLFIYPDVAKAKTRPELKAFVDFYLENTTALSAEVGYVALPDALLQEQKDTWAAAVGG
ncbi:MAG: PstS family phosphate ABC transporter substrate-binding protein [Candidatus Limnocylindrales bacterium]|nr:PstS family phosphate ABC transporter substrate-binding protein [Candidatus Limnocylindrales bacterium]